MFKEGDKVVYKNIKDDKLSRFKKYNKIYIIDKIYSGRIQIKGYNGWLLSSNNFIPLTEYRKMKINKILDKCQ